ncbi:HEPN domain-containing protein [Pedobacter cryoconitis]|uniref:HEPN domain-containing protein n=1 Tax=Pedobacter cryoconitis TaxID=188932 RepID=A0A327SR16_9SPHI|nr:HEPN domain-containing protein [Pedobacter cryoconitis]RAJ31736.1 HEPN domain-containing protein [Pedobacter cryoconitis]
MKKQKLKNLPMQSEPTIGEAHMKEITAQIVEQYKFEKIVCFGSQVNIVQKESCFVDNDNQTLIPSELNSYYLLLVPSKDEKCADIKIQQRLEEQFKSVASVTILIHRMDEFNNALQNGSSFFKSIYKKGIILHDNNEEQFVSPGEGAPINKRITLREEYWVQWYKLSLDFVKGGKFYIGDECNGLAVFMLHQALQHCYSAMIRVLTGYRINSNSLRRLLKLVDLALPDSSFVTPHKATPEDTRLTGILLKGFSDARYDDAFIVTKDDLTALLNRITLIIDNANKVCSQRIADLKDGKAMYSA